MTHRYPFHRYALLGSVLQLACLLPEVEWRPLEASPPGASSSEQAEAGTASEPGPADRGPATVAAELTPMCSAAEGICEPAAPSSSVPAPETASTASSPASDSAASAAISCADGLQNGSEILVDCGGGTCPGCPDGTACASATDCSSGICSSGTCQSASCEDNDLNGTESAVDCGGSDPSCPRCPDGDSCRTDSDCASATCSQGACISCTDGDRNGTETDVDCGGPDPSCRRCASNDSCALDRDCQSGLCNAALCASFSCNDDSRNGTESDVDCGGADPTCARCAPGLDCAVDNDCASGACVGGSCCGGTQGDCTRCAERLSPSIDCDAPAPGQDATGVTNCRAFLQCLATNVDVCSTRNAPGCSGGDSANDACSHQNYGGNAGTGVTRATQVLQNAGCQL